MTPQPSYRSFGLLLLSFCIVACTSQSSENADEAPAEKPVVAENQVMHDGDDVKKGRVENMHQTRFIELFFAYKEGDEIVAECYNTMFIEEGIPGSKDTAPQELVAGLDFEKLAKAYGVLNVSLNGPKIWLPDWTDIDEGKERNFEGIGARWVATLHMGSNTKGVAESTPYQTLIIKRKSSLGWNKGTRVMLMDDDEGNTYIMKGFQLGLDPKHTYEEFLNDAEDLYQNLPEGWKVRVAVLEEDLIETPEGGNATIMPDEFFNVWDKTGPGMTNYQP